MPAATRQSDCCTGHDACPPVPLVECSPDVIINGLGAGRVGDHYAAHGCVAHPGHQDVIAAGSGTVFINGKPPVWGMPLRWQEQSRTGAAMSLSAADRKEAHLWQTL